ncbi:unnamed protein product [Eruca vesicaria subsp. sativa]|uniref:Plant PDR ABC transporter associated domain-containing protein n=1 Tax=Eruca vesicaria subsp. sativa TaxID=29727 RepID=A0ABC8KVH1_ERUVS|nr:unnamed protein product [Eruca vesicaria subsp. sativa]
MGSFFYEVRFLSGGGGPIGYLLSPMISTVNEMFAPGWMNKMAFDNRTRLGTMVLRNWDVYHNRNWYWIGVGALLGFTVLFNLLFTLVLTYLNPLGKKAGLLPEEESEDS